MAAPAIVLGRRQIVGVRHGLARGRSVSLLAVPVLAVLALLGALPDTAIGPLGLALLVGLPHGAVDHVALQHRIGGPAGLLAGTVGYAGAAGLTFLVAGWVPMLVWPAFLLLSVLHFGTADREYLARIGSRPSPAFAVAAGAVPVGALVVVDPAALRPLAMAIDPAIAVLLDPPAVAATAVALALVVAVALVAELRERRVAPVLDLVALVALFALVPPLWAFGAYFGLWHALRHVVRTVATEAPWAARWAAEGPAAAVRGFGRDAALPTSIALAAVLVLLRLAEGVDDVALAGAALQVTAAVTFPHVATVALLDQREDQ